MQLKCFLQFDDLVAILPEWLADSYAEQYQIRKLRLGEEGIFKTLYASIKEQDNNIAYIKQFIHLGKG